MKRLTFLALLLLVGVAVVGWRAAPATRSAHESAPMMIGNSSVSGNYAFSETFHDLQTSQEGASAGTLVFDGAGHLGGIYSQAARCSAGCGDQTVTRATILPGSTYVIHTDGSATLDLCINAPSTTVEVIWEGAFSTFFIHFRYVQTVLRSPCDTGQFVQSPNVTSGTADKL